MVKYLQRLFSLRIVRYALVGGIGIPINLAALAVFLHVMGDSLYPLALACSLYGKHYRHRQRILLQFRHF